MAGKRTYINGQHATRKGRWVPPANIKAETWEGIQQIIGRELTDSEKDGISGSIGTWKSIYRRSFERISNNDIRRDLISIQNLSDDEAAKAFHDCAASTEAVIESAALAFTKAPWEIRANGADIKRAARLALENGKIPASSGGNPGLGYRLLFIETMAVNRWGALGMTDLSAWARDGIASPFTRFVQLLVTEIEGKEIDAANLSKLIRSRSSSYL